LQRGKVSVKKRKFEGGKGERSKGKDRENGNEPGEGERGTSKEKLTSLSTRNKREVKGTPVGSRAVLMEGVGGRDLTRRDEERGRHHS